MQIMSYKSELKLVSRSVSLPYFTFQIPLDGLPDYPPVLEHEKSATETHCEPDSVAQAARVSKSPDSGLSISVFRGNTTASMLA